MADKVTTSVEVQMQIATAQGLVPLMTTSDGEIIFFKPNGQTKPSELREKIVDCYKCLECGRQLMFGKGKSHIVCPACGSSKLERTTMGEMLNKTITVHLVDEDNKTHHQDEKVAQIEENEAKTAKVR